MDRVANELRRAWTESPDDEATAARYLRALANSGAVSEQELDGMALLGYGPARSLRPDYYQAKMPLPRRVTWQSDDAPCIVRPGHPVETPRGLFEDWVRRHQAQFGVRYDAGGAKNVCTLIQNRLRAEYTVVAEEALPLQELRRRALPTLVYQLRLMRAHRREMGLDEWCAVVYANFGVSGTIFVMGRATAMALRAVLGEPERLGVLYRITLDERFVQHDVEALQRQLLAVERRQAVELFNELDPVCRARHFSQDVVLEQHPPSAAALCLLQYLYTAGWRSPRPDGPSDDNYPQALFQCCVCAMTYGSCEERGGGLFAPVDAQDVRLRRELTEALCRRLMSR